MLRIGARSAIAANFDPENETALPFERGGNGITYSLMTCQITNNQ